MYFRELLFPDDLHIYLFLFRRIFRLMLAGSALHPSPPLPISWL